MITVRMFCRPARARRATTLGHAWRWVNRGTAMAFGAGLCLTTALAGPAGAIAAKLDLAKATIAREVGAALGTNRLSGSYTTVWRQFEDAAIQELRRVLPQHVPELVATNFDAGSAGREKNRPADLALVQDGEVIEISIKSASGASNPENDLGTFREHEQRKRRFKASFTLWVRYARAGEMIRCERVYFDRTWRFVGKSTLVDGVKYRKKDGNLRPKSWAAFESNESPWNSETEFEAAVQRAETFRANELIKEHLADLSEDDLRLLYERLRQRFEER